MANRPKHPMPISERAKQFSPFSPLKGLGDALAQVERDLLRTPRRTLSDEAAQALSNALSVLKKHNHVMLIYHFEGEELTVSGTISAISQQNRVLRIDDLTLPFDDVVCVLEIQGISIADV